jgi:hypothetical protein
VAADTTEHSMLKRRDWNAKEAKSDLTKQSDSVGKIIIGHTVTDLDDSKKTILSIQTTHMDSYGFSDIAYNFCLDTEGYCYECRDCQYAPALLKGHNLGSCGIGVIGDYRVLEQKDIKARTVSKEVAIAWGKHIGKIAHSFGIKKLTRLENIFGQCELDAQKYPDSPGQSFMEKFDLIVKTANQELLNLQQF